MTQAVTAVLPQGAAVEAVETDVGVYCLNAGASLAVALHVSFYLLWGPLLLNQQREDALAHVEGECADPTYAVLVLITFSCACLWW